MKEYKNPNVGVGVLVYRGEGFSYHRREKNELLMVKRHKVHGSGTWSTPGGYLEFGESFEDCAVREVKEETEIAIARPKFYAVTNDVFPVEGKHFVTIWMRARYVSGDLVIGSPDEIAEVEWFNTGSLPNPLFIPLQNLLSRLYYR